MPEAGDVTHGPFYDLDKAGGKYRTTATQVEFMPERYAQLRKGSDARFRGEGGESYGLYTSTDKDLGPGQHVQHTTWLAEDVEKRKDPKGFTQGSTVVSWPWGRDEQLRIPEGSNSWLILGTLNEPVDDRVLKTDERLQTWKANGHKKGKLIMKCPRIMAPWSHPSSPF